MKKRIFVAFDISEEARRKIADYISNLKTGFPNVKAGWEEAEKLHLTLKFLGDSDEKQIENLSEIVEKIAKQFSTSEFQLSTTGVFPSPKNARVLWLGVEGDVEKMRNINSGLENECEKIGFKKENRDFKPHLTIARLREPQKSENLVRKHLENKIEPVRFEVSSIVIYESKLQPAGSIYRKLKEFSFSSPR